MTHAVLAGTGPPPFRPHLVDLDTAPIAELAALPGIGPGRAAAIVLDRVRHGPFPRVDDLARVPGIGPATVEALRAHARVRRFRNPAGPR